MSTWSCSTPICSYCNIDCILGSRFGSKRLLNPWSVICLVLTCPPWPCVAARFGGLIPTIIKALSHMRCKPDILWIIPGGTLCVNWTQMSESLRERPHVSAQCHFFFLVCGASVRSNLPGMPPTYRGSLVRVVNEEGGPILWLSAVSTCSCTTLFLLITRRHTHKQPLSAIHFLQFNCSHSILFATHQSCDLFGDRGL